MISKYLTALLYTFFRSPLYQDTYSADTNAAGVAGLTKLAISGLSVGLTYYIADKVGTDTGGVERFVMRPRTILATDPVETFRKAIEDVRAGNAYTTNGGFVAPVSGSQLQSALTVEKDGQKGRVYATEQDAKDDQSEKVAGHFLSAEDIRDNPMLAKKGYRVGSYLPIPIKGTETQSDTSKVVRGDDITVTKSTNSMGVQNDEVGGDGKIADNTTNEIQAEQIAHTIYQTTDAPVPAGKESADRLDGDKAPSETKTTTPAGVQNDDNNQGTGRNAYDNVPKGGSFTEGTGAEYRADEEDAGGKKAGRPKKS